MQLEKALPHKYVLVDSGHPKSKNGKYYEHNLIIENLLCRFLVENESVHHINEIKHDNRIENLFLCSRYQHDKAHGMKTVSKYRLYPHWKQKICSRCGETFYGNANTIRNRKRCSISCKSIKVDKLCYGCGSIYTVPLQHYDNWEYCSRLCKRKANNDASKYRP